MRIIRIKSLLSIILCCSTLGGCTTYTEDERLWRRSIDNENWEMCALAYYDTPNAYTIHTDHVHRKHSQIRPHHVKSDLNDNRCQTILRDYWIEY